MLRYCIADFFSCIGSAILSYNCEEPTVCIFVIVLFAVDKGKTAPVIFHNGFAVFAAVNHTEDKQFFGIASVKETLNTHGLRREHDSNMIVVRNFFQYIDRDIGINDHFPIP